MRVKKHNRRADSKFFARTASSTKKMNVGKVNMRGGIRL